MICNDIQTLTLYFPGLPSTLFLSQQSAQQGFPCSPILFLLYIASLIDIQSFPYLPATNISHVDNRNIHTFEKVLKIPFQL
jgi:hypothetical protein